MAVEHDRALHNRLVLALDDLVEAQEYARQLLSLSDDSQHRTLSAALHAALVVAYGRCFAAGRGVSPGTLRTLPSRYYKRLPSQLRAMHERLMELRHTEFAHSDAEAASITVERWDFDRQSFIVPRQRRLRSQFSADDLKRILELIVELRVRLFPDLIGLQGRLLADASILSRSAV